MTLLKMTFALSALTLTLVPQAHAYAQIEEVSFPRPTVAALPQSALLDEPNSEIGGACEMDILHLLAAASQRPLTGDEIAELACFSQ